MPSNFCHSPTANSDSEPGKISTCYKPVCSDISAVYLTSMCPLLIRGEDGGVSPEAPNPDPWPGTECWWVPVLTSAFNELAYCWCNRQSWWNKDPLRPVVLTVIMRLINLFQVSPVLNPKKPSAASCGPLCCSRLRPKPPLRAVSAWHGHSKALGRNTTSLSYSHVRSVC